MSGEKAPICPECGSEAVLTNGQEIYPKRPDLHKKSFWICRPCNAYVGCHPGSQRPLGTPATKELRSKRSEAHAWLDPLWDARKVGENAKPLFDSRSTAYKWLAAELGLTSEKCHIGMMDFETASRAAGICKDAGDVYAAGGREVALEWVEARVRKMLNAANAAPAQCLYADNPLYASW